MLVKNVVAATDKDKADWSDAEKAELGKYIAAKPEERSKGRGSDGAPVCRCAGAPVSRLGPNHRLVRFWLTG